MADDPQTTLTPIQVTMIGTGTGDGSPMTTGTVGTTPDHQPNLVVQVVTPLVALAVRFANFYLGSFMGSITLALTPTGTKMLAAIGIHEFMPMVMAAASAALVPTLYDFGKNLLTITSGLEKKYPLATGAI